jgi:hypothetical protein
MNKIVSYYNNVLIFQNFLCMYFFFRRENCPSRCREMYTRDFVNIACRCMIRVPHRRIQRPGDANFFPINKIPADLYRAEGI